MKDQITIALAQINSTVGAIEDNIGKIRSTVDSICAQGKIDIIVFPELTVSGYPPEDLILNATFIDRCTKELDDLKAVLPSDVMCIVGVPRKISGQVFNSAAIIYQNQILGYYDKALLPNYSVFDEKRIFSSGNRTCVVNFGSFRFGLHICEDSWHPQSSVVQGLEDKGLNGLINLSASPYYAGRAMTREVSLSQTAENIDCTFFYCNTIGGQDELIFDGGSFVMDAKGSITLKAKQFEEDILLYDYVLPAGNARKTNRCKVVDLEYFDVKDSYVENPNLDKTQESSILGLEVGTREKEIRLYEIYNALVLGIKDYANKNKFERVLIAISGGIDSTLVAALAVDALGKDRVVGITMPTIYSSSGTLSDAQLLAERLGIEFHTIPIQRLFDTHLEVLSPFWQGLPWNVAEENLQARIRGTIVMSFSNKMNWLVLSTGNKSEHATGYATLYGDMCGGFAAISDVPKTLVFQLCRWKNLDAGEEVIPESIIVRPPSAELRPDQKDTDSLPPYPILDSILEAHIEHQLHPEEINLDNVDPAIVTNIAKMVLRNEHKRRQSAPGIKITSCSFGKDRRMPITNGFSLDKNI